MSSPSKPLLLALTWLFSLLPTPASAQATGATNAPDFQLTTTRHELEGLGHYFRAVATVGTNRLAFIVPKGYFVRLDEANRQLRAIEHEDRCSITVRLLGITTNLVDLAAGTLKPAAIKELVLERFPAGHITEEFALGAAGRTGPAFDVTWKNAAGLKLQSRLAFILTPAGILEFHLMTGGAEGEEFKYALNSLMLTLRVAENGKLELPELSNKL